MEQPGDNDHEQALSLVLGHQQHAPSAATLLSDQSKVERFFIAITSSDIEAVLAEFQYSADVTRQKEASQALIAYFNWCWQCNKTSASDGTSIDNYVLRFSRIAFGRMVGNSTGAGENFGNDFIPKWVNPNVALGWSKPPHRPREDTDDRDIAIAAFVEKLRREDCELVEAKKRAVQKFGRKMPTVEKALQWDPVTESAFGKRFEAFSTEELGGIVRDYFESLQNEKKIL